MKIKKPKILGMQAEEISFDPITFTILMVTVLAAGALLLFWYGS